jgi:hypothetical protein
MVAQRNDGKAATNAPSPAIVCPPRWIVDFQNSARPVVLFGAGIDPLAPFAAIHATSVAS